MDVDIRGPEGNAMSLMGNAERWAGRPAIGRFHLLYDRDLAAATL